jgi:hypothetical protein
VYVFEIRDGIVTKFHIYPDRDQAFSAARELGAVADDHGVVHAASRISLRKQRAVPASSRS